MRCLRSRLLILAGAVVTLLPVQAPAQVLAYVGPDSITIEAFSREYRDYLEKTARQDALQTRFDALQQITAAAICARYGRAMRLDQDPGILRAGSLAWREVLLNGVARSLFADEVSVSADEIQAEYRYRNTALLTHSLSLPDSLTALDYLRRLKAGEPFESLALQASGSARLLDRPGEPGWKFPRQLDSTYARRAYELTPGQLTGPLRTARGYQIIQLLGKEFRPNHGHFERVKYHQQIATELRPLKVTDTARDILKQWSAAVPIAWRKRAARKLLRSGQLEAALTTLAANPAAVERGADVLFTLDKAPYTVNWVLSRLDLLLPEERSGVTSLKTLEGLVRQLIMWDQLVELAASLPRADSLMAAADEQQQLVVRRAVEDSVHARILRQVAAPDDSLRQFLAAQQSRYTTPALVNLEEIVVRDSTLAAVLRDSLLGGDADFGPLARRHTEREWARRNGGRLGWVPLRIYGSAAAALSEAAVTNPGRLVGPLKVNGHYVLARPSDYRAEAVPPFDTLRPRLHHDWIAAHRRRLIREWLRQLQGTTYPTAIDTSLVARLHLDERGQLVFPAVADSSALKLPPAGAEAETEAVTFPPPPDSTRGNSTPANPE